MFLTTTRLSFKENNMFGKSMREGWQRLRVLSKPFIQRHSNTLTTNTLTCGILMTAGDMMQQRIGKAMDTKQKDTKHDMTRTGRMFLVGLSQGPPHHYWYIWLDKWLPKRNLKTVGLKILADQFLAAPFFAITFIIGMGLLEDKRLSECLHEFIMKFPAIYLFDWIIWPPSQFINFKYVPQSARVLYVNVITVVWDICLSYIKHNDDLLEDQESSVQ